METKDKAKEVLDYVLEYVVIPNKLEIHEFQKTKRYKEMLKEIEFMIDSD